jgi:AraC family transcriptional regulator, transcriptional activator of pobA
MDSDNLKIPTFDPLMLELKLLRTGGEFLYSTFNKTHNAFHINRIEDYIPFMKAHLEKDINPFRLTVFNFMFLTQGTIKRSKGLSNYEIGNNTFFFVPAFEISTQEFISEDAKGFYCHFNLDLLSFDYKLKDLLAHFPFLNFNCNPIIRINSSSLIIILNLLERLDSEYKKGTDCKFEVIRAYLITLFVELLPFVETTSSKPDDIDYQITKQYKKALAQYIYEKQKIEDYADMIKISAQSLNKSVKSITGKRAIELLNEMILLEAKVLLKQTTLSISEITYKLGQEHISNFVRFFKTKTGISPGEFRNRANPEL